MIDLIPILVSKQDAEGDNRCNACAKILPFGVKAWQNEAKTVLCCWDNPTCLIELATYEALLPDEAEEMIPNQGELL